MSVYENKYEYELDVENDEEDSNIKLKIRLGFIRKVYGIILFQVFLTALACTCAMFFISFQRFIINHSELIIICFITALITEIMLVCCKSISTSFPTNYILLLIFTISESYMIASLVIFYETSSVLVCALVTFVMVLSISIYACFTKKDFTLCGTTLFLLLIGLTCFSLIGLILSSFIKITLYQAFLDCAGVILFGFYLIYDTQLVIGRNKKYLSEDDYIGAALQIYIDIITIFIKILSLLGKKKK